MRLSNLTGDTISIRAVHPGRPDDVVHLLADESYCLASHHDERTRFFVGYGGDEARFMVTSERAAADDERQISIVASNCDANVVAFKVSMPALADFEDATPSSD